MNKFIEQAKAFWQDEDGLSAVEYVVAGALVVGVLVVGFTSLGGRLDEALDGLNADLNTGGLTDATAD
ncbi:MULTISPECIES: Flp family type IVb pilin [Vibrio]|jgi:pilus assembly protein Flp/PilA|uniref:Flp pilus assembly pilin Flp n=1 Tax=Vibrio diazotrophicus TaxID=685 RepID=A0A329EN55_VIBDI|nr:MULTISPECIES: Flp family type IVb pilin [Vibrio]MCF7362992.1 Flp family type IVb pilin [Vibrio sp. A1-b2]RAS66596.1 Flp pilus assembly pilin Flp [Vibrio diazotrophicus]